MEKPMRTPFFLAFILSLALVGCRDAKKTDTSDTTSKTRTGGADTEPGGISRSEAETKAIQAMSALRGNLAIIPSDLEQPALEFTFHSESPVKDEDFKKLRPILEAVPRGVGLNLNQCGNLTDAAVEHLKGMANLKALSLGGTKVTPKCFDTSNPCTWTARRSRTPTSPSWRP
jgi:hypothetical protein